MSPKDIGNDASGHRDEKKYYHIDPPLEVWCDEPATISINMIGGHKVTEITREEALKLMRPKYKTKEEKK